MIELFMIATYISSILAIAIAAVMCVLILLEKHFPMDTEGFGGCLTQICFCANASIVFLVLAWFLASGQENVLCIAAYGQLAELCFKIGRYWIFFAFFTVLFAFLISVTKHGTASRVGKLRSVGIKQTVVFLILAFLLDVV